MDDDLAPVDGAAGRLEVHHVALDEAQVRMPLQLRELKRVAMKVVVDDDFVVLDEALNEMRSDEPGAAGNAHPLPRHGHDGNFPLSSYRSVLAREGSSMIGVPFSTRAAVDPLVPAC